MASENLISLIMFFILILIAIWAITTGAEGALENRTIIGTIFGIIIFFVGIELLSNAASGV